MNLPDGSALPIALASLMVVAGGITGIVWKIVWNWLDGKNKPKHCSEHGNMVTCVAKVETALGDTKQILIRLENKVDGLFDQAFSRISNSEGDIKRLDERTRQHA